MNLPAAIVILVLLLFGPLALHLIERNIEVYALALGILATLFAGGFEPEVVKHAVTEPILISVAVIAAGLVFGWTRDSFERLFAKLRRRIPRAILAGAAILVLAALSSLITAIVAALVLVEIARLLHLERSAQANVTIAGCFAIGLGAALTPIGEPLSTLAAHALGLGFFGLFYLLAPYVIPGMIAASIVAGVFARESGERAAQDEGSAAEQSSSAAIVQGLKVYAFVAGLVLISNAYAPLATRVVATLSNDALFWANTVSAALDNATLVALEVHDMTLPRAREAILALLISGGMLIPGNIPNIVSAGALRIGSLEWARLGVPMGLVMLGIYFAVLKMLA
jgi:predicted cation transporter